MATYVMSDIHGCYDKMIEMLQKIEFSTSDKLILAGDYVDRGPQIYEMLKWIADSTENVVLLKGNHDGDVYRAYDEEMDCIFYDVDCGCVYKKEGNNAKLACLRLEDEAVFFV